ncbi:hypothetical protein [Bradyrhizobium australafricanum]|uniref:hypothetical protein n=1 Tax=Bradyrhizobium australafricanum TaxID=2821406 RepID=UPI001CE30A92|nr:hypothetical protein [Bradyrhizobium australafricanum]MCA6104061.1 hypothetical protein [Bradyrhizobium australafricanum]
MKKLVLTVSLMFAATSAQAQWTNPNTHTSSGYTRSNGTCVQPYVATNPNGTQRDNFSSTGNTNPYTGAAGHRTPRY